MKPLRGSLAALLLAMAFAHTAIAHSGADAFVHVPRDHINPGQEFPAIAADLDPHADIAIRFVSGETVLDLGTVATDSQGHFETSLLLPANVPTGYGELVAGSPETGEVRTWVRVGPREEGGAPAGSRQDRGSMPADPSAIVLLVFVLAASLVLGYLLGRSRLQHSPRGSLSWRGVARNRRSAGRH